MSMREQPTFSPASHIDNNDVQGYVVPDSFAGFFNSEINVGSEKNASAITGLYCQRFTIKGV